MNQWVETRDGRSYWYQQYTAEEMQLLKKYRKTFSRLTKMDLGSIFEKDKE
jgi:hypothetical protein